MKNIKTILITLLNLITIFTYAQKDNISLYIGTYTSKTSESIYVYQFNTKTGDFMPISIAKGISNPSFFKINKKNGKLSSVGHQPVNGETPRNFAIDPTGNFILVANQGSDNITIFKRDKKTGKLTSTGKEIKVSMPVCLKFIP